MAQAVPVHLLNSVALLAALPFSCRPITTRPSPKRRHRVVRRARHNSYASRSPGGRHPPPWPTHAHSADRSTSTQERISKRVSVSCRLGQEAAADFRQVGLLDAGVQQIVLDAVEGHLNPVHPERNGWAVVRRVELGRAPSSVSRRPSPHRISSSLRRSRIVRTPASHAACQPAEVTNRRSPDRMSAPRCLPAVHERASFADPARIVRRLAPSSGRAAVVQGLAAGPPRAPEAGAPATSSARP